MDNNKKHIYLFVTEFTTANAQYHLKLKYTELQSILYNTKLQWHRKYDNILDVALGMVFGL